MPSVFLQSLPACIVTACGVVGNVPPSDSGTLQYLRGSKGVAAEMRKGWIYPRWLSMGFNGLGSPSFYFYPPLPFLIMGGAKALAGGVADGKRHRSTSMAFLLLFASGHFDVGMGAGHSWTRVPRHACPAWSTWRMPYHLFDYMVPRRAGRVLGLCRSCPLLLVAVRRHQPWRSTSGSRSLRSALRRAVSSSICRLHLLDQRFRAFRSTRCGTMERRIGAATSAICAPCLRRVSLGLGLSRGVSQLPALNLAGATSTRRNGGMI